jgi:hypothetical protein
VQSENIFNINEIDIKVLSILLLDRTTRKNILWATNDYVEYGDGFHSGDEIKTELIADRRSNIIQPRVLKALAHKQSRTRKRAEVFTPAWVCNEQNNSIDEQWFGKRDVFNAPVINSWVTTKGKIQFDLSGNCTWKKYVDAKRLEISCGEAPYLVSRYDMSTGKIISLKERIGFLDRKFRVINENTMNQREWLVWAKRAVESIYGYEYQGDSLLIARINVLETYIDYYKDSFGEEPEIKTLCEISRIISWNLWQMDGMSYAVPYCGPVLVPYQMSIFDYLDDEQDDLDFSFFEDPKGQPFCKIHDWRSNETLEFIQLVKRV